ncbi:uncharacterized protein LOC135433111 [Drosophila montana]|uniref:uncharacterized protein LOC135433111 n=1 Tax=Drosophila montana TaxID=40370 RepID=UPI00313E3465
MFALVNDTCITLVQRQLALPSSVSALDGLSTDTVTLVYLLASVSTFYTFKQIRLDICTMGSSFDGTALLCGIFSVAYIVVITFAIFTIIMC